MPQIVRPRMWEPGCLRRATERAPAPRLVSRLRPRLAILAWKNELIVVRTTRGHPPGPQIRSERCQQPHGPMLPRFRVGFLAERDRALNQDGPLPNIAPAQPERPRADPGGAPVMISRRINPVATGWPGVRRQRWKAIYRRRKQKAEADLVGRGRRVHRREAPPERDLS
jgi:hypothetical protein